MIKLQLALIAASRSAASLISLALIMAMLITWNVSGSGDDGRIHRILGLSTNVLELAGVLFVWIGVPKLVFAQRQKTAAALVEKEEQEVRVAKEKYQMALQAAEAIYQKQISDFVKSFR